MNIAKFIKETDELKELPFLIVFRVLVTLQEMGILAVDADELENT